MLKALDVTALSSSATSSRLFLCSPFVHCAVRRCILFKACHGTGMSYRGHRWWGRLPYSNITTVSRTCRFQKYTCMADCIAACPIHPSTGQDLGPAFYRNVILNIIGSSPPSPYSYFFLSPLLPRRAGFSSE